MPSSRFRRPDGRESETVFFKGLRWRASAKGGNSQGAAPLPANRLVFAGVSLHPFRPVVKHIHPRVTANLFSM